MIKSRLEKLLNKRPLLISIVCAFGFINALLNSPRILKAVIGLIGAVLIPRCGLGVCDNSVYYTSGTLVFILVLLYFSGLVSLLGYWKMKRWGVYIYLLTISGYLLTGPFFNLPGTFNIVTILIFLITAITGLFYLKAMD